MFSDSEDWRGERIRVKEGEKGREEGGERERGRGGEREWEGGGECNVCDGIGDSI